MSRRRNVLETPESTPSRAPKRLFGRYSHTNGCVGFVNLTFMACSSDPTSWQPALRVAALCCVLAIGLVASQAQAQAQSRPGANPSNSLGLPIDPSLLNTLPEIKGVVPWSTLAQVRSRTEGRRVIPEFAPPVRALDKQEVRLQGFMLPIVTGERHDHFLLTMRPPHCPFCLSLGPEYIVEVRARIPIKHTYDPIIVVGQLNVLSDDPFGLYYRLTGAQQTTVPAK